MSIEEEDEENCEAAVEAIGLSFEAITGWQGPKLVRSKWSATKGVQQNQVAKALGCVSGNLKKRMGFQGVTIRCLTT